jgi:hypothetical protein
MVVQKAGVYIYLSIYLPIYLSIFIYYIIMCLKILPYKHSSMILLGFYYSKKRVFGDDSIKFK